MDIVLLLHSYTFMACLLLQLLFVVSADSGSNIGHTSIAHFHIISVEYFVQACFLEMSIN